MKKLQTTFAAVLLLIFVSSCKKNQEDTIAQDMPETAIVANASKTEGIIESDWKTGSAWTAVHQPSHSVFFTNVISDISAETSDEGLVRVFKTSKDGTDSQSLPFEETVNGEKYYWYYQVTEGNVMIAVDAYGSKTNPAENSQFKTVVFSKNAVNDLESKNNSKSNLMKLTLENVKSLNN